MALALINTVRDAPSGHVLEVDTGSNRFFRYVIGGGSERVEGFDQLTEVSYESPIRQRIGTGAFQTSFEIEVADDVVDRRHRHLQLISFRDAHGNGPAWSEVVQVHVPFRIDGGLAMSTQFAAAGSATRTVPMSLREQPLSGAMMWGELLGLVDDLAPLGQQLLGLAGDEEVQKGVGGIVEMIGPLVQQLLGAVGGSAPAPSSTPLRAGGAAPVRPAAQPAAAQPIVLVQPSAPCPRRHTPQPVGPRVITPGVGAVSTLPLAVPQTAWNRRLARATDGGVVSIPAVLGLISALGPTVMKVLTPLMQKAPEMFQTYMDHPIKLLNAVADIDRQEQAATNQLVEKMVGQGNQQLLLTMLNGLGALPQPGIAPPSPTAALGVGQSGRARILTTRTRSQQSTVPTRTDRTIDERIDATLVPPAQIDGVSTAKALYAASGPISLELVLATPFEPPTRPIPHVVAHVRVSSAITGTLLLERRVELSKVLLNRPTLITLPREATATLPSGADLNVSVDVTWTGSTGAISTTPSRAAQNLCLVADAMIVDEPVGSGIEISVTDPRAHRAFWHRIWEGGSARHKRWELNLTTRYYYVLTDKSSNGRMESKVKLIDDRSPESDSKVEWGGLLKSGMELAPDQLNGLLPTVSLPMWSASDLRALGAPMLAEMTSVRADTDVHFRGRTEERGACWVFPVLEVMDVDLHRVAEVDANGAVVRTNVERKQFPLPVAAVFVGMENEG